MSSVRRPHGRLFQIRGPAAPKLLIPNSASLTNYFKDCNETLKNIKQINTIDLRNVGNLIENSERICLPLPCRLACWNCHVTSVVRFLFSVSCNQRRNYYWIFLFLQNNIIFQYWRFIRSVIIFIVSRFSVYKLTDNPRRIKHRVTSRYCLWFLCAMILF